MFKDSTSSPQLMSTIGTGISMAKQVFHVFIHILFYLSPAFIIFVYGSEQ